MHNDTCVQLYAIELMTLINFASGSYMSWCYATANTDSCCLCTMSENRRRSRYWNSVRTHCRNGDAKIRWAVLGKSQCIDTHECPRSWVELSWIANISCILSHFNTIRQANSYFMSDNLLSIQIMRIFIIYLGLLKKMKQLSIIDKII